MQLKVRPLTPDLWPALEDLFGAKGACSGCWCMYWRIGAAYRKKLPEENRVAFRNIVKHGPPPGLIAFDGDQAVGWCQLTPRDALPWLDRAWRLKRVDDMPVWSLSCFYVRIGYRKKGRYVRADCCGFEGRKTCKGTRARSLSTRCRQNTQRLRHRLCHDLRTRRIQDRRLPHAASADHAP